jgi:DNA-binding NtrC family response regulator
VTAAKPPLLTGRRVLIVEDELMIAELWEMALKDAGCEVLGPFPRIDPALRAIAATRIDAALLDVNLRGETVLPVAAALAEQRVPFLFVTGYGPSGVPAPYRDRPVLTKPCPLPTLLAAFVELVGAHAGG